MTPIKPPIHIKIDEKGRKLEDISKGDILVFPHNRIEIVRIVDIHENKLYTQRKINRKLPEYISMFEKVLYESGIITSRSIGKIYQIGGIRK